MKPVVQSVIRFITFFEDEAEAEADGWAWEKITSPFLRKLILWTKLRNGSSTKVEEFSIPAQTTIIMLTFVLLVQYTVPANVRDQIDSLWVEEAKEVCSGETEISLLVWRQHSIEVPQSKQRLYLSLVRITNRFSELYHK